jgi:hypothetical protein
MVIKINYTSSDVYVSTSVSPVYVVVNYSGVSTGGGVWGQITGTLSNQTDLQTALDDKVPYTGATANVDLGGFSIKPSMVQITGINSGATGGVLNIKKGNTRVIGGDDAANNISLWAETAAFGFNDWVSGNLRNAKFSLLSITNNATRTYTLPNLDGTLALLSDIPSVTGFVPYTGATQAVNLGAFDLLVQGLTIGKGNNALVNNTALGHSTLLTITTGNFNTAVGYEALRNTTTGQYNTAVGQSSLFSNTTGGQNTALGLNALLYNTTGSTNVAVGLDTLQHITTGSSNTAIGYNAGSHITGGSTPNTTATNSVFIGRDSKAGADGQTNQIVIGQNAVGNGSNTATFGNTATTGNYFTGSINGGSFVKSGGTSSQFLKADGSVDGTTYVGGSGATGQVAYWNGTNSQTGSNNLFWDAANGNLGIGTNSIVNYVPSSRCVNILSANNNTELRLTNAITGNSATAGLLLANFSGSAYLYNVSNNFLALGTNNTARITIFAGGNVAIGTGIDSGQRLQVQGDAFIKGSGATSATTALTVQNSDSQPALQVRNNKIVYLFGTTSTAASFIESGTLHIASSTERHINFYTGNNTGTAAYIGYSGTQLVLGDAPVLIKTALTTQNAINSTFNNSIGYIFLASGTGSATGGTSNTFRSTVTFAPTSASVQHTSLSIAETINQTGGANGITRGLYVNPTLTAAADWRSIEWSNNSGWGLYGAGTANNYLGGNLLLGSLSNTGERLQVTGTMNVTGASTFGADMTLTLNQNAVTGLTIINNNNGAAAASYFRARTTNNATYFDFVKVSNTATAYKIIAANDALLYNAGSAGDIAILNDWSSGKIKFAAGASSTAQMTLTAAGRLLLGLTAESTFLLDVNGTARVSGAATFSSSVTATQFIVGSATTSSDVSVRYKTDTGDFSTINDRGTHAFGIYDHQVSLYRMYINASGNVGIGITSPTAALDVKASTTSAAAIRLRSGTAPTSPNDGDIWFDGTDLKMRIGGVTKTFTLV